MDREGFGGRLREARLAAGFEKGVDFALTAGTLPSELSRHENSRKTIPRPEQLVMYSLITGRSIFWLLPSHDGPAPLDDAVPPDEPHEGAPGEVGAAARARAGDTDVGSIGGMAARAANDVGEGEAHPQTMPVDDATREGA